jgi:hypothetical protein
MMAIFLVTLFTVVWKEGKTDRLYAADARQRIVSERLDMINNAVISVSVTLQILSGNR